MEQNLGTSLDNLEIHILVCKRDLILAINNIKSFRKYEELSLIPIVFHDDGSLDENSIQLLNTLNNITIIPRDVADKEIYQHIKNYPNAKQYRLGNSNINLWHKIKLFDFFYFSKTKNILCLDSDLLFFKKPNEILNYVNSKTPFYFPDIQSSYCFNEPKNEISVLPNVNTGIIYIPSKEFYNIEHIEFALNNLIRNNINYFPSWIEQSAFSHMFFKMGHYKCLNIDLYRIPYFQPINVNVVEGLHFVSYPAVRKIYDDYLMYIDDVSSSKIIYSNKIIVNFENKKIPLVITINKKEKYIILDYFWGLRQAEQQFLDHVFKIKTKNKEIEYPFQSHETGSLFFSYDDDGVKIELYHTYCWYKNRDWKFIDVIKL